MTTTGAGNETASYPDRVKAIMDLADRIARDVARDMSSVLIDIGSLVRRRRSLPRVSNGDEPMITPHPSSYWPEFGSPTRAFETFRRKLVQRGGR